MPPAARDGDRTPVLILTARDAVADRVAGLDAGPTTTSSSRSRSTSCSRASARCCAGPSRPPARRRCAFADLVARPRDREVRAASGTIELTRTEFLLLELFLLNPRQVLPARADLRACLGVRLRTDLELVEVYVGYLRRKIEADGEPRLIQTVRGVGYALRASR